jgi:hypothetical protein
LTERKHVQSKNSQLLQLAPVRGGKSATSVSPFRDKNDKMNPGQDQRSKAPGMASGGEDMRSENQLHRLSGQSLIRR